METRVALVGIIVENEASVAKLNELLHRYGSYIIGRMGIPYKKQNIFRKIKSNNLKHRNASKIKSRRFKFCK